MYSRLRFGATIYCACIWLTLSSCDAHPTQSSVPSFTFQELFELDRSFTLEDVPDDAVGAAVSIRPVEGGIAVADMLQNNIKIFDRVGRRIAVAGGAGSGPGEFRFLRDLAVLQDGRIVATDGKSVAVFSEDAALMNAWSLGGAHVQSLSLHPLRDRVIISGIISDANLHSEGGISDLWHHEFSLTGERIKSFDRRPTNTHLYSGNIQGVYSAMVGNVLVSAARMSDTVKHHDVATGKEWSRSVAPGIYRSPNWPEHRFRVSDEAAALRAWSNQQMWITGIIPLSPTRYALAMADNDPETDDQVFKYVIADLYDGPLLGFDSGDKYLHFVQSNDFFFSTREPDGSYRLQVYRYTPKNSGLGISLSG